MIKIYTIGMSFENPDYDQIFELLDEGSKVGIESKLLLWLNVKKEQEVMDGDAYIFIEMRPVERIVNGKPFMYISHTDTYDDIADKLEAFTDVVQSIQSAPPTPEPVSVIEDDEQVPVDPGGELIPSDVLASRIREVVVKIKDQSVKLNPGDLALLVKIDKFIKDNGYVIEEIIV